MSREERVAYLSRIIQQCNEAILRTIAQCAEAQAELRLMALQPEPMFRNTADWGPGPAGESPPSVPPDTTVAVPGASKDPTPRQRQVIDAVRSLGGTATVQQVADTLTARNLLKAEDLGGVRVLLVRTRNAGHLVRVVPGTYRLPDESPAN